MTQSCTNETMWDRNETALRTGDDKMDCRFNIVYYIHIPMYIDGVYTAVDKRQARIQFAYLMREIYTYMYINI